MAAGLGVFPVFQKNRFFLSLVQYGLDFLFSVPESWLAHRTRHRAASRLGHRTRHLVNNYQTGKVALMREYNTMSWTNII